MPFRNLFSTLAQAAKHLFVPSFCVHCKAWLDEPTILCVQCRTLVHPIVSAKVEVSSSITMTVFAASIYEEPLKSIILAKSRFDALASKQMGQLLWELTMVRYAAFDCIVPIPLHWRRYAYRGYNQASLMAHELSKKSKQPVVELLRRKQYTIFQSVLTTTERQDNVKHAFVLQDCNPADYHGKHILLVDDLMTTGATLKAAAKCLLPLKPASISAVVLCRT